jgi:hypothetical protein
MDKQELFNSKPSGDRLQALREIAAMMHAQDGTFVIPEKVEYPEPEPAAAATDAPMLVAEPPAETDAMGYPLPAIFTAPNPDRVHKGGPYFNPTKKVKEESKKRRKMAAKSRKVNRR